MMREEGEAERQEKQESLYIQNPSSIIRITKCFYHFPPSTGLFSQGLAVGALDSAGSERGSGQMQGVVYNSGLCYSVVKIPSVRVVATVDATTVESLRDWSLR